MYLFFFIFFECFIGFIFDKYWEHRVRIENLWIISDLGEKDPFFRHFIRVRVHVSPKVLRDLPFVLEEFMKSRESDSPLSSDSLPILILDIIQNPESLEICEVCIFRMSQKSIDHFSIDDVSLVVDTNLEEFATYSDMETRKRIFEFSRSMSAMWTRFGDLSLCDIDPCIESCRLLWEFLDPWIICVPEFLRTEERLADTFEKTCVEVELLFGRF